MERNGEINAELVVYKLVRVEVDGTLVPATDDDVVEAGLMLQEDMEECSEEFADFVSDPINLSSGKSDINSLEGSSLSESSVGSSKKLKDRLEFAEAILQKVNQEEKLRVHWPGDGITHPTKENASLDKLTIRELQEAFMATFGRPTSIKDKWQLKQRLLDGNNFSSKNFPRKRTSPTGLDLPPAMKRLRKPTKRYIEECTFSGSLEEEVQQDVSEGERGKEEMGRRKRHRLWSLWEVTRLVEGVSQYGVGRWSEIKRHVFPSHTHRTSADLKDKWRNLLRACLTERDTEKRNNSMRQNHTAAPIPAWVLARVRELAEISNSNESPSVKIY